jgi:hypothetical protein
MVREIIEAIEHLHAAGAVARDEPPCDPVGKALARCLQELRAIVALEALDPIERRPLLRIV